jgi:hypothetical protein
MCQNVAFLSISVPILNTQIDLGELSVTFAKQHIAQFSWKTGKNISAIVTV